MHTKPVCCARFVTGGERVNPGQYLKIAMTIGADSVFIKPVDWDELLQAVRDLA